MTIAIVAHYLGPKLGIGQYIDRIINPLVDELQSNSIDITILASPNAFKSTPSLQELQEHVEILPFLDSSPFKRYQWFLRKFKKYCADRSITQVLWLSNPIILPWHPSSIAVIHDFNEWKCVSKYGNWLKTKLRSMVYLDTTLSFAEKIILISEATERDLRQYRPKFSRFDSISTIPNGTDSKLSSFKPVVIPYPNVPFFLSVGRIDPVAKRLYEAVSLVEEIRNYTRINWEVHFLGGMNLSTQAAGETFLSFIQSLDWAHYHGHVSDAELAEWYRNASAVIFLSDNEGFGFPIAEAASFRRWSIISDRNSVATEFGSGSLIQIDADQPQDSARKVISQLNQLQYPNEIKLQTWKKVASAYVKEIKSL